MSSGGRVGRAAFHSLEAIRAEFERRAKAWKPNPGRQTEAVETLADETFYGGAAGGGKSDAALGIALRHWRSIIFRREFPQLAGLIERGHEIFGPEGAVYNITGKTWKFPTGQKVELGAIQYESDKQNYQGRPHDLIGFDELPQFPESIYRYVIGWNRPASSAPPGQRLRVFATGNPPVTAEGQWVRDYWAPWLRKDHPRPAKVGELRWFAVIDGKDVEVDGPDPIEHHGEVIRPRSRTFIRALVKDNPYLWNTAYVSVLQSMPEPYRSAFLEGDFDVEVDIPRRAYWAYDDVENVRPLPYIQDRPIVVMFDWNVDPCVAALGYELGWGEYPPEHHVEGWRHFGVFGEVFIRGGYDVRRLVTLLLLGHDGSGRRPEGWHFPENFRGLAAHQNDVLVDGDPAGQARRVESVDGPAWQQVTNILAPALRGFVPVWQRVAPPVIDRLAAMNAILGTRVEGESGSSRIVRRLVFDPRCIECRADGKQVRMRAGESFEIEKAGDPEKSEYALRTHLFDGIGYHVARVYPPPRPAAVGSDSVPGAILRAGGTLSTLPELGRRPW